jgi:protein-L-isoaspartate(D-aspartate) O-methyltransferase
MRKLKKNSFHIQRKLDSHERAEIVRLIAQAAQPFDQINNASLDELLTRIGDMRIVLLGESTHGTSEFYQMRGRITQELISKKGFNNIAIEADWPDVEQLNRFIRHLPHGLIEKKAFKRFPSWMWKNEEFHSLVRWLRSYHSKLNRPETPVNIYGLDLYNSYQSINTILSYLSQKDPKLAKIAQKQYECLLSWGEDLSHYGLAAASGLMKECEDEVISILIELLERYAAEKILDEENFFPVFQNAVSVVNAEEYYRSLYQSSASAWNIRDQHMFETLETILMLQGEAAKIVVWAHNSHVGNAAATEMSKYRKFSLGQLCKEKYGEQVYLIGFGTHKGTVAATTSWNGALEIKEVKASHPESVERLFHDTGIPSFFLPLQREVKEALMTELLYRAIGVIYLPENERRSHYFHTILPRQFDEYVWFDHTHAIAPISVTSLPQTADTYPFGV